MTIATEGIYVSRVESYIFACDIDGVKYKSYQLAFPVTASNGCIENTNIKRKH